MRFKWYVDKETKKLTWRDLTGPEKVRLFQNINIPTLFPSLEHKDELQTLWKDFFYLIQLLGESECVASDFEDRAKAWVRDFTSLYQSKDVTPYMHAFAQHVPEFLRLYDNNIVIFSQQGLEKLNDLTTKHFQRASNHQEGALKQVLEKRNRIEFLEDSGYQRTKKTQVCSNCQQSGHNRRTCTNSIMPHTTPI